VMSTVDVGEGVSSGRGAVYGLGREYGDCSEFLDGLVSWWRFEGNALDEIGGNDGSLEGGVDCNVEGKFGKACDFNGVDDFVSGQQVIKETSSSSLWFKYNGDQSGRFYNQAFWTTPYTANNFFDFSPSIRPDNGYLESWAYSFEGGVRDDFIIMSPVDYRDGEWHHFVVTFNAGTGYLYVDGERIGSDTFGFTTWETAPYSATLLGGFRNYNYNSGPYYYSDGMIDEPMIFNKALSEEEVKALYELELNYCMK